MLRDGIGARSLSWFTMHSSYPGKAYESASSAWYPEMGTSPEECAIEPPIVARPIVSLADIGEKEATLVMIFGLARISNDVIEQFPAGIVNAHNGLLPHFRGLDSPGWAYAHGEALGYTLHFIDGDLDSGEVITRREVSSGSKVDFDKGIVTDLSALSRLMLAGHAPVRHEFLAGRYYPRMSLSTRHILDLVCRKEARTP
jgi:Folate-dependent phosphoribosylglycinamide formyltransferase PurN